jgi:phage/plasmid-like protein (TIGR03299 family)
VLSFSGGLRLPGSCAKLRNVAGSHVENTYERKNEMANHTFKGLSMRKMASLAEAVEAFGMDFEPLKLPLRYDTPAGLVTSPRHVQIVHGETHKAIGVVGLNYENVAYPVALNPAEALIAGGARIVGGGCPNNGERAYLVLESDGIIQLSRGDTIVNRFLMLSSHDGTGKIEVRMTPYRPKTGTAITTDASHPLAFKHTKNVRLRLGRARKIFTRVNQRWDEFSDGVKKMVSVTLNEKEAREFIEAVLPHTSDEPSQRLINIRQDVFTIFRDTGIGTRLPKCRGTLFGVVQAFTEWADIKRTVRKSDKRDVASASLDAKLVSDSAKKKQKAWAMALYLSKKGKLSGALSK